MSFQDDLIRNRAAFLRLSTGGREMVETPLADREGGFDEGGFVPEHQFRQNQIQAQAQPFAAVAQPGVDAPDGAAPMGATGNTPDKHMQPRVYRLGSGDSGKGSSEMVYPPLPEQKDTGEEQDLLEALVRRMEAGARRYPQEIGREGSELW